MARTKVWPGFRHWWRHCSLPLTSAMPQFGPRDLLLKINSAATALLCCRLHLASAAGASIEFGEILVNSFGFCHTLPRFLRPLPAEPQPQGPIGRENPMTELAWQGRPKRGARFGSTDAGLRPKGLGGADQRGEEWPINAPGEGQLPRWRRGTNIWRERTNPWNGSKRPRNRTVNETAWR